MLNNQKRSSSRGAGERFCILVRPGGSGLANAFHRANGGALRGIVVAHALYAGIGVDYVDGGVFSDGIGRALGQARAACDAVIVNFHCHRISLLIDKDSVF